jgi:hypothetical protein
VRHRVMESKLGRWTKRDPIGYASDSANLSSYDAGLSGADPSGLMKYRFVGPYMGGHDACGGGTCARNVEVLGEGRAERGFIVAEIEIFTTWFCCDSEQIHSSTEHFWEDWSYWQDMAFEWRAKPDNWSGAPAVFQSHIFGHPRLQGVCEFRLEALVVGLWLVPTEAAAEYALLPWATEQPISAVCGQSVPNERRRWMEHIGDAILPERLGAKRMTLEGSTHQLIQGFDTPGCCGGSVMGYQSCSPSAP